MAAPLVTVLVIVVIVAPLMGVTVGFVVGVLVLAFNIAGSGVSHRRRGANHRDPGLGIGKSLAMTRAPPRRSDREPGLSLRDRQRHDKAGASPGAVALRP